MSTIAVIQELGVARERVEALAEEILPGCTIRWAAGPGPVSGRAKGAEILVTVNEPVDADALEALGPRLVAISFTGTDHVDLEAARRLGIAVANVPAYATASVAELTLGLVIALLRQVPAGDASVRAGTWKQGLSGIELEAKTVGVVGTGRIGVAVARRLGPFGCRILGWSRSRSEPFLEAGGTYCELDDLLARSHVVTLHVPLSDDTRGLIGARELELMKPGSVLVNTARGPVVDTDALAEALEAGKIGGAAIDVFDSEPVMPDHRLLSTPRTLLTPHVAFATTEALERKARSTMENIRAFLDGLVLNRVDTPDQDGA
jgi:D-3-phosphoglycerate dehydrogenase